MGGFECSTHRRKDGKRLDLVAATSHDRLAFEDYSGLRNLGVCTVRDGLRWHLIEKLPGTYDWSSLRPMLRAAADADVQVIWDLCHYGWPSDLDIWSNEFVERFALFCQAAADVIRNATVGVPLFCVINEVSYWAWAGGEAGLFNPAARKRGPELKRQLVRASIAATRAIKATVPEARFIVAEPIINVITQSKSKARREGARSFHLSQYEACDMISGRQEPELGGETGNLDLIGLNFYPVNQWVYRGATIPFGHHAFRPLSEMLKEAYERYGRPILIAETGAEGSAREAWLNYVCAEVRTAIDGGVPVLGVCLYPILDYPGWDNDRCCATGLLGMPDEAGKRALHTPLAAELVRQQATMDAYREAALAHVTRVTGRHHKAG